VGIWRLGWNCQHPWEGYIRCFMHPYWSHSGRAPRQRGCRSLPRLLKWRGNWNMRCGRSWTLKWRGDSCFIWWIGWAMDLRNTHGSQQQMWSRPRKLSRIFIVHTPVDLRRGTSLCNADDLILPPHARARLQLPPTASNCPRLAPRINPTCLFGSFSVEGTTCHKPRNSR